MDTDQSVSEDGRLQPLDHHTKLRPQVRFLPAVLKEFDMGRKAKNPVQLVGQVTSKKQLLDIPAVCVFLGGISSDTLKRLRDDPEERFPKPLQIVDSTPMWSVEQIEKYVARKERDVESLSA